jgi:hypothetical protein
MNKCENISWEKLYNYAKSNEDSNNIDSLKSLLKIEDVKFLLKQISHLEKPENIKNLTKYQKRQKHLGAWVDGLFPNQFTDTNLIVPDNFSNKIKCMLQLAEQRKTNIDAIKTMGEYTLNFKNNDIVLNISNFTYPECWDLKIDLSVMEKTLNLFKNNHDRNSAIEVSNLNANQQMLIHRRNLGYLPEPITDTEDLTKLLIWAVSDKPEDLIWKWLNPLNIFELADVYNNQSEFQNLYKIIKDNKEHIKNKILSTINEFIKKDIKFNETFSLTFGFAIRGWATDEMFGINIENIKDDYQKLISSIAHELFHRLQIKLCISDDGNNTFTDLVCADYVDEKDNKFYEVLSYIMMEGTGEFITHQFKQKKNNLKKEANQGLDLLEDIYKVIYFEEEIEKTDKLINQGLKSNGVFYSLGEYISECLVKDNSKSYLGDILEKGVSDFFIEGHKVIESLEINNNILTKLFEFKSKTGKA